MASVPISEQIACVERELRMRHRAYPRWVNDGRMTQAKATAEIAAMEGVLATLRALAPAKPEEGSLI